MNRQKQKRVIWISLGGCFLGAAIWFLIQTGGSGDVPSDKVSAETEAMSSERSEGPAGETTSLQQMERLRTMTQLLVQQSERNADDRASDTASSGEPPKLRPSTAQERQVVREGIVLDSIAAALKSGERERARTLLRQQRTLFPTETDVESGALTLVEQCIDAVSPSARSAAEKFIAAHPDFRLNRRIARICLP